MKYFNFKRYKFSTVFKNFGTLGSYFLQVFKFTDLKRYNFRKTYRYLDIRRFNFTRNFKYLDPRRYNFTKNFKYLDPRIYNFNQIKRKISFVSSKFLFIHLPASLIFFGLLYFIIPTFYNYDKSIVEKKICKDLNIECLVKGKINYSFLPTPRINIKDLIVNDLSEK